MQANAKSGERVQKAQQGCLDSLLSALKLGRKKVKPLAPCQATLRAAPKMSALVVQPSQDRTFFEGWGTSLCWFGNIVGGFPDPLRDQLMDLLFDHKTGLGIEICRYNIGGSGPWPGNRDTKNFRYGADLPSFWGPDGSWDWSLDENQRWVMLQARERGACIFEAFSNSPPFWMTYSGRGSGNRFAWLDNLKPERYDDFIHYLTEVIRWYRDTHDLVFRTIDPFNEPSSNYWWAGNNQEGCHFGAATQNVILLKLQQKLITTGLAGSGTSISASDETSIDVQVQSMHNYSEAALSCISQVNTHCYSGNRREELRDLTRAAGKRLWMSEVGFGSHAPSDIQAGLDISRTILADLNVMQANAWVYWQAIENNDTPTWWGLIQVPYHTGASITIGKQFYGFLQYSKYIKNGWSILETNHPDTTLAAVSPRDSPRQAVVLVISNFDGQDREDEIDVSSFKGASRVHVRRTSASENFAVLDSFDLDQPATFSYVLPGSSITTFLVVVESASELTIPKI